MLQYFRPGSKQKTNKRILELMDTHGVELEFAAIETEKGKAREREKEILSLYYCDHLELPPQNRQV